jgi:hypothetical protein
MQREPANEILRAIGPVRVFVVRDDKGIRQLRGVCRDMLRPPLSQLVERIMRGRCVSGLAEGVEDVNALTHAPAVRSGCAHQLTLRVEHQHRTRIPDEIWDQYGRRLACACTRSRYDVTVVVRPYQAALMLAK